MCDIFLSYSSDLKNDAHELYQALKKKGLKVFFDDSNIDPGALIPNDLEKGLKEAEVLVVMIGDQTSRSLYVQGEIEYFRKNNKPIIPVLAGDTDLLPTPLRSIKAIFLRESKNMEEVAEMIAEHASKRGLACYLTPEEMEERLRTEYGLRKVCVVPTSDCPAKTPEVVGEAAANLFFNIVSNDDIVGISCGTTLKEMARRLPGDNKALIKVKGGIHLTQVTTTCSVVGYGKLSHCRN